jgi:hypothetical protein
MLVHYSGWGRWVYDQDLEEMGYSKSEINSGRCGSGRVNERAQEVENPCIFELPEHAEKDITLLGKASIDYLLPTEYTYIDMDLRFSSIGEIRFYLLDNEPVWELDQQKRKPKKIEIKRDDIIPSPQEYIENVPPEHINTKQRKKLIPLQRVTNTALLLLDDIFKHYKVTYLDELKGIEAWGKIITREFTSEYIESIGETKNFIMLTGHDRLIKDDFLEKYRKRFK